MVFEVPPGPAAAAQLAAPVRVAVDEAGTVYVADTWAFRVRAIGTDGIIRTVAGTGGAGEPVGDGEAATAARVFWPAGLALDRNGALLLADAGNHRVRSISRQGIITTAAGSGSISVAGFSGDGGRATEARLSWPKDVAIDSAGNLYVADTGNNRVRVVSSSGMISTLAGEGTATQLNLPSGLTIDGSGNLAAFAKCFRVKLASKRATFHSGISDPPIEGILM